MAKEDRVDPLTEGSLQDIYRYFFGKLIFYKPDTMSIKEWLEHLFHFKEREILRYKTTKPFRMPGLFYQASTVKVQGMGYRDIPVGTILWVRTDSSTPNTIDVECMVGQGQKDHVFCLDSSQWGFVQLHCVEAERRRKKT